MFTRKVSFKLCAESKWNCSTSQSLEKYASSVKALQYIVSLNFRQWLQMFQSGSFWSFSADSRGGQMLLEKDNRILCDCQKYCKFYNSVFSTTSRSGSNWTITIPVKCSKSLQMCGATRKLACLRCTKRLLTRISFWLVGLCAKSAVCINNFNQRCYKEQSLIPDHKWTN